MNARPHPLRRLVLRLGAGTVILLALGGPTPGYIGSCTAGSPAAVDPQQFCIDRKVSECYRDRLAMRTTQDQYVACANAIATQCEGATFNGCAPSPQLASACITALRDESRIGTPNGNITECFMETLCGGAPLVSPDDGI